MIPISRKGKVADMEPSLFGSSTFSPEQAMQASNSSPNGSQAPDPMPSVQPALAIAIRSTAASCT